MDFLCGTYFKHLCRHQFTDYTDARSCEFSYIEDPNGRDDFVFCRPEFVHNLKGGPEVERPFSLILHNSDVNFYERELDHVFSLFPNLETLYTQNLLVQHPNAKPIPIGIANPRWSHGNQDRFSRIIEENNEKDSLFYANFNVSTNPAERVYCYQQLGIESIAEYPNASSIKDHDDFVERTQEDYLRAISKSYFTISPDGNGKDCHKTWEALYMGSIPIVTDSYFARAFRDLGIPILIIKGWSQFKSLKLGESLYNDMWGGFNAKELNFKLFE